MNQPTAKTRKGRKKWVALREGGICEVTTIRTDWKATCGVLKGYVAHLEAALEAAKQRGDFNEQEALRYAGLLGTKTSQLEAARAQQ